MGADLDQRAGPAFEQPAHDRLEANRLPQAAVPVLGAELGDVELLAGDGGVEGDLARARGDRREGAQQLLADALDLGGVSGVLDRDALGLDPVGREIGHQPIEGLGGRRDHHRGRAVDRGHRRQIAVRLQPRRRVLGRERDRRHPPLADQGHGRPAVQRPDPRRVVEREAAGDMGRGDLALRVPDHGGRLHAALEPQLAEGDRQHQQRRLEDVQALQRSAARIAQRLAQRPLDERLERLLTLVQATRDGGRNRDQLGSHPRPLAPLAREDEHRLTLELGDPFDDAPSVPALGQRAEAHEERFPVRA